MPGRHRTTVRLIVLPLVLAALRFSITNADAAPLVRQLANVNGRMISDAQIDPNIDPSVTEPPENAAFSAKPFKKVNILRHGVVTVMLFCL